MTKVTLELKDFKALASETRIDILRVIDGKKLSLKEISEATNLTEMTIHEHLSKLVEAEFVKKEEREGHKWVYYKLSWKGASLLHPENTRVVILFCATFFVLFSGAVSYLYTLSHMMVASHAENLYYGDKVTSQPASFPFLPAGFLLCFVLFLILSLWRWKKNKTPRL